MAQKLTPEQATRLRQSFAGWIAIESFLMDLEMANRSPRTVVEYRKTLHMFMLEIGDFSFDVSPDTVRSWIRQMRERGCRPRTIAGRLTVLSSFFNFAVREGRMGRNPVAALPKIKLPDSLPKSLNKEQIRLLFATIDAREGIVGRRDRLLFRFMYHLGLRVSEAVSIRVDDLNLGAGTIRVQGKGDKERLLYMKADLVERIREWIDAGGPGAGEWLFPGMRADTHLSDRVAQLYITEYRKRAGLKHVSCHTLRHSHATHSLMANAPITHVQKNLGHSSLRTTAIYTQLVDEDRRRIANEIELAI